MLVRSWEISLAILSILFRPWEFLAPVIFRFEDIAAIWEMKAKIYLLSSYTHYSEIWR